MQKAKEEPCVCSQVRRAARLISQFYDERLLPAGISVTQYALLARIGRSDGLSRTVLAAQLGMERTTLTRNLAPLERAGLVSNKPGEDRREKHLYLTAAGQKVAATSKPYWQNAQERMLRHLGPERWRQLQEILLHSERILEPHGEG